VVDVSVLPLVPAGESRTLVHDVEQVLDRLLRDRQADATSPAERHLVETVRGLALGGGKRVRPLFCYWGWRGAGGTGAPAHVVAVAAALELFHVAALIHDDVIDESDVRRGRPSLHRALSDFHRSAGWRGDSDHFGRTSAVLAGDACLIWSDELLHGQDLGGRAAEIRALYARLRTETVRGEYLDVVGEAREGTVAEALTVAVLKTGGYTVRYPLQLGAHLAGADPGLLNAYDRFGARIGQAFQLRDDLCGLFGDPAVTGKSAADDVRRGKATALVALARDRADADRRRRIDALYGCPTITDTQVRLLRDLIEAVGARTAVEQMIADLRATALAELQHTDIPAAARTELGRLALRAVDRIG
jgi:geranylgeranyl diphosphate synthase, type I